MLQIAQTRLSDPWSCQLRRHGAVVNSRWRLRGDREQSVLGAARLMVHGSWSTVHGPRRSLRLEMKLRGSEKGQRAKTARFQVQELEQASRAILRIRSVKASTPDFVYHDPFKFLSSFFPDA